MWVDNKETRGVRGRDVVAVISTESLLAVLSRVCGLQQSEQDNSAVSIPSLSWVGLRRFAVNTTQSTSASISQLSITAETTELWNSTAETFAIKHYHKSALHRINWLAVRRIDNIRHSFKFLLSVLWHIMYFVFHIYLTDLNSSLVLMRFNKRNIMN